MNFCCKVAGKLQCYVRSAFHSRLIFSSTHALLNSNKAINVIIEEKIGPVTLIAINRPDCKNELDLLSFHELCSSLQRFQCDESSSAAVIYGIGGNFCTGCHSDVVLDSREMVSLCRKPMVAGVTGFATGFGFELAMMCDLRVMEETAQIGLNAFPIRLSDFFYQRLLGAVGSSVALDLALTGRNFGVKEALEIGIANRSVECGTGIGQAISLARCIGKYPIKDLVAAKEAVYSALTTN